MAMNSLALSTNNISAQLAGKLDVAGGKVLQVVRATDTTNRSTTSTSYVDVTGMSVTITPQRSTSAIMVIAVYRVQIGSTNAYTITAITDSSNNILAGGGEMSFGAFGGGSDMNISTTSIGYAAPATTSPVTYKLRHKLNGSGTVSVLNASQAGQMYAIEVSA